MIVNSPSLWLVLWKKLRQLTAWCISTKLCDAQHLLCRSGAVINDRFHELLLFCFVFFPLLLQVDVRTLWRRDCKKEPRRTGPDTAAHGEECLPLSNPFPAQSSSLLTNCTAAKNYGYLLFLGILTM